MLLSDCLQVNLHQHIRVPSVNTSGCRDDLKKIPKIVTSFRILQPVLLGRPSMKGFENSYEMIYQHEQRSYWLNSGGLTKYGYGLRQVVIHFWRKCILPVISNQNIFCYVSQPLPLHTSPKQTQRTPHNTIPTVLYLRIRVF